jgi:hypothetical protein
MVEVFHQITHCHFVAVERCAMVVGEAVGAFGAAVAPCCAALCAMQPTCFGSLSVLVVGIRPVDEWFCLWR